MAPAMVIVPFLAAHAMERCIHVAQRHFSWFLNEWRSPLAAQKVILRDFQQEEYELTPASDQPRKQRGGGGREGGRNSSRQDPLLVARACALARSGQNLQQIDAALHSERWLNSRGKVLSIVALSPYSCFCRRPYPFSAPVPRTHLPYVNPTNASLPSPSCTP